VSAPEDWTAPGTFEVAPGVYRIPLPMPNDGLRAVNVYALPQGERVVMIDGGWALAQARERLVAALAELGYGLAAVSRFLVTHVHRDHYSQAVAIRREFGTRLSLGGGEEPSVLAGMDDSGPRLSAQFARLREYGAAEVVTRMTAAMEGRQAERYLEPPDDWLRAPVDIPVAGRTLRAIATPGHTQGHLVYRDAAAGLLFAGDHVLPHITPSIGFEPAPGPLPLGDYLESLRLVRALPDTRLLPAHGPVCACVHGGVDELLAHHAARLDAAAGALAHGVSTAYEVAGLLGWTRHNRALADLDPFNQLLAVNETGAHLDLLAAQGKLTRSTADGVLHYTS
jgi:glyoxylase-like metal-dependent hydrolase (beta-lactamase superfamily II)